MYLVIEMVNNIILNTILVTYPMLIYFVFSCYNISNNKIISKILLIVTLLSSLYLSIEFNYGLDSIILLFANIPIVIAYLKKEYHIGIVLSLIIIVISCYQYQMNLILFSIKFFVYYVAYFILCNRKDFKNSYLTVVATVQGFFLSFEYFFTPVDDINNVIEILVVVVFLYIITFASIYLFTLADKITSLYKEVSEMEKQKQLKDGLFKLTHEIKNPIAVCKGYLDMLDVNNKDKLQRYIPIISSEIDRSLNIMKDFMDYSKIKVEMEVIDMTLLLEDIYESFKILFTRNNIVLNYDNNYDDILIKGDYNRLKQVFINILKNSMESIVNDGIISIRTINVDKYVEIEIEDNGMGMTKEELGMIKAMFYTTKKNGTGLGICLSNEIIQSHFGTMKYKSQKNVGTICTISLPIYKGE